MVIKIKLIYWYNIALSLKIYFVEYDGIMNSDLKLDESLLVNCLGTDGKVIYIDLMQFKKSQKLTKGHSWTFSRVILENVWGKRWKMLALVWI